MEGFLFGRLLERRPEARPELLAFRDALTASANQEQKLKASASCNRHQKLAQTPRWLLSSCCWRSGAR